MVAGGYAAWALVAGGKQGGRGRLVFQAVLLALPFLVADGAWMARNWPWYHRPVPLQTNEWAGYQTPPALRELSDFTGIIGEEPLYWEAASDISWFYKPLAEPAPNFRNEPGKLAPPAYTYDSLVLVKRNLAVAQDSMLPATVRQMAATSATRAVVRYARAYRRQRPFQSFVLVPFKLAYRLTLAHPGDYLFRQRFAELVLWKKAVKIMAHLWYLAIVGLGLFSTLFLGWQRRFEVLLVKSVPIYLPVLLCFILFKVEFRYFAVAYPFVVIGAVNFLLTILQATKKAPQ
jgi:hypothetical protein